jgi:hypothetical protein
LIRAIRGFLLVTKPLIIFQIKSIVCLQDESQQKTKQLSIIAVVVIVVAILLLAGGGGHSIGGFMHGSRSMGLANWNWIQILVSLGIGFILGLLVAKRRL